MQLFLFSIGLILISFNGLQSCSKTTDGKWIIYKETTQLPFWAHESSDRKSKNTLETFLKSEGIIPLKIKIIGDRIATCKDCDCFTGLEYRVQVEKSQVGYMAYWGFELK
tara:strand:+ start:446 stop:775 length:330 start_codon:yes stop_codon:yes gene_type:complete